MKSLIILSLFSLASSCGDSNYVPPASIVINKVQSEENLKKIYSSSLKQVHIRVFYEPGAEPFAGNNDRGQPVWGLLEKNIQAVFNIRSQNINLMVPKELTSMTLLPAQNKVEWSAEEVNSLSSTLGVAALTEELAFFTVIFLKGSFKSEGSNPNSILGISLNGTTVIAIFKDAINLLGPSGESLVVKFGEQATLVHEIGHALGIVANGVNAVSDHHDKEHGNHCTNTSCVMYWMNEGNKDLLEFIRGVVQNGNSTLYGALCLDDIKAYTP